MFGASDSGFEQVTVPGLGKDQSEWMVTGGQVRYYIFLECSIQHFSILTVAMNNKFNSCSVHLCIRTPIKIMTHVICHSEHSVTSSPAYPVWKNKGKCIWLTVLKGQADLIWLETE